MFVDLVKIKIKSGKGGDGRVSFHREKYIAAGGPDGGDGGRGGNVVFKVDDNLSTLLDFRMKRKYIAEDGEMGGTKKSFGKTGKDIVIRVPRGTLIKDADTGLLIHDMSGDEPFIAAHGGRGGWGNTHFATPTRQAPRFAKPGLPGQEFNIILELKLIADVGLVGFPNVGKSTLLSVVSAARPKIANYHFTTLSPNLGVVYIDEGASFVMADIPGIIEGAAEGAGLGHDFLRHIDRCRLLVHIIDVAGSEGRDPVEDLEAINAELGGYSAELAKRPQIVVANKLDILEEGSDNLERLKAAAEEKGFIFTSISAAAMQGVQDLMRLVYSELQKLPPIAYYEPEYVVPAEAEVPTDREINIEVVDGVYVVSGAWIDKIVGSVFLDEYESRMYFERILRKAGVFDRLEAMGIEDHDLVNVAGVEFEYIY
ncbi:MAG: GTPase ObgE [Clostridia bacterium]|nr:GTPase ObgE [Clostridia bacterium]MBQ5813157.1 GTPase ObgE [Clostridia bacterium]